MRAMLAALVGTLLLHPAAARDAAATHTSTFHVTLAGSEEVPPNASIAAGSATAGLNADGSLTYSVSTTGFATAFRVAHIHTGPAGVAGPILIFLDCNVRGTMCSGTTRPLTADEVELLEAGDLYVNMHTDEVPSGEIRGQLRSVESVPATATSIVKFAGKATGIGGDLERGSEIRVKGRFTGAEVDLRVATAVVGVLLDEVGGAGELVRGPTGTSALPIPLFHVRRDKRGKEAMFTTVPGAPDPECRLKLKRKGPGDVEFQLDCKRGDGATIPLSPTRCSDTSRPATSLRTVLWLKLGTFVAVDVTTSWLCSGRDAEIRELKAVEVKGGSGGEPGGENRAPKADFQFDPKTGTAPLTVTFENRSADSDGDALTFEWLFGDGASSNEPDPTHIYTAPGEYDVELVVRDARGLSSSPKRGSVTVRPGA